MADGSRLYCSSSILLLNHSSALYVYVYLSTVHDITVYPRIPDTLITHSCNSNVITLLVEIILCVIAAIIILAGPSVIKPP